MVSSGTTKTRAVKKEVPAQELDDKRDFGIDPDEDELEEGLGEFEEEEDEEEPEDEVPEGHDKVLNFDDIIGADDLDEEELYIPKWKGMVVIRSLTKREFDHMRRMARMKSAKGKANDVLERELIIAGLVKPPLTVEKYERLQEHSAGALVQILNAIYKKSGLEDEGEVQRERRFPRQ